MTSQEHRNNKFSESNSAHRLRRAIVDRLFRVTGFAATFFGLAMLVVLFAGLAVDAVAWFRTTPVLIEQRNSELQALAKKARELDNFIKEETARIDKEMEAELDSATTEEEKKQIRQEYEDHIKPRMLENLKLTAADYQAALSGVRQNTSAGALLAHYLTNGPSSQPQDAGIFPALLGSIWVTLIAVFFAVPLGVGAAIYLEEYRATGWLARVIQINITNLAGVPSVVFGILGAFVFVELIFKPLEIRQLALETGTAAPLGVIDRLLLLLPGIAARNVLGGGLTLSLLTLPMVIVASQEAIRAVPASIRHAGYALGATRWQVIWHQVLPASLPGILTGTILSMSRAIGEAAPLILFGALLFISGDPGLFSRFTILPMQIFGWADRVDDPWRNNAAMGSIILLLVLLSLNAIAIFWRQRAQRRVKW